MSGDIDRFVERFSALLVDGGMPRMPARVFSRVLAEDSGQLTAAEIAERLDVSPAAVSASYAVAFAIPACLVMWRHGP